MLTTHVRFVLFTKLIAALLSVSGSFELPFLQTCTFEDEQCHAQQVEKYFEMYADGIEELHIPTSDPMYLGNITIKGNSNENFNLQLHLENVILHKYPKVKCLSVKGFSKDVTKQMRIDLTMFSPRLVLKAHCRVKGKLLLLPLAGEVDLTINIKNVTTHIAAHCLPYMKDGMTYMKVDKIKPTLDITSISTSFANSTLFNGEEIFMETFAATIDDNWQILRDEIEPHLNKQVAEYSKMGLNKILPTMPYDNFFKKS